MIPSLSSHIKGVYAPKSVILHAALLHQSFLHCAIFPTAASRRSLDRVSVPVWLIILSNQLSVIALVSRYLTNKLILYRLISKQNKPFPLVTYVTRAYGVLAVVSNCYPPLRGTLPIYYSPVRHLADTYIPRRFNKPFSFDLHVLSTPPAFTLSQDQTLHKKVFNLDFKFF